LVERPNFLREIAGAGAVLAVGTVVYTVREGIRNGSGY
jgi:hypothetical protein